MQRRDLIKGAALSTITTSLLAPTVTAAAAGRSDSEASAALAELQATLDELESAFVTPEWKLRTPQDFAEARRVLLHVLMHALES